MKSFNKKDVRKKFFSYVIPSVIGMLVAALYVILDGVVVGQGLGEVALAAINIVFPFTMVITSLSMLIAIGGANIYSIYKGEKKLDEANNVFNQCLVLAALVGLVLGAVALCFNEGINRLLGANDEVLPDTMAYLTWVAPLCFIQMIGFVLSIFIRNDDAPKYVMIASISGSVVNIALDVIFIYFLKWGIELAAITNIIGMMIELCFYITHLLRKRGLLRLRKPTFHRQEIKRVTTNGIASALMEFSLPMQVLSFNLAIMYYFSTKGATAYSVVSYITAIINMVMIGVSQGAQPLMSLYRGERDEKRFMYVYRLGLLANLAIPVVLVLLLFITGDAIIPLFNKDSNEAFVIFTSEMLWQYSLAYVVIGMTLMNILYFQATEKNAYASLVSFLRCFGFVQIFILLSVYALGGQYLYITFFAGEVVHFIISLWLVLKAKKSAFAVEA